jgi:hypothetical protein
MYLVPPLAHLNSTHRPEEWDGMRADRGDGAIAMLHWINVYGMIEAVGRDATHPSAALCDQHMRIRGASIGGLANHSGTESDPAECQPC